MGIYLLINNAIVILFQDRFDIMEIIELERNYDDDK